MSTNKKIAKSAGVIGLATLLSRFLGLIRDTVIARFFGTAMYAEAFVVAWRLPNLLRDLVGEGATNAAFVPVLTEQKTKYGDKEFWHLSNILLNVMILVLFVLTVLGMFFSPQLVRLIAPGFASQPDKLNITINLARVIFPYLFLVGLSAYGMGVLNSLGHFATPAFGMSILNLVIIISAVMLGENIAGIALGILLGGVLQLAIQIPPLMKLGFRLEKKIEFRHPAARRIGILLIPRTIGASIYQINVFVSTIMASLSGIVGQGAVAALYYANRVMQLPLAIFGIALAQAALPSMSMQYANNDIVNLKKTTNFSLRAILFVLVPSTVGLLVLSRPITNVLFERGHFTSYSTAITSNALFFYAFGLVASGAIKVLVNTFFSMQDTKTPVKIGAISLVVNVVLNVALMYPLKAGGLALANSVAATGNFFMLFFALEKRLGSLDTKILISSFLKFLVGSIIMGLGCYFLWLKLSSLLNMHTFLIKAAVLTGCIGFGIFVYVVMCFLLKVSEVKELLAWILRKK